jgi:hypothetical protein
MVYDENPPSDQEEHFALDTTIDQWLSLLMLRIDTMADIQNVTSKEETWKLMEETYAITADMEKTWEDYKNFLFRNF